MPSDDPITPERPAGPIGGEARFGSDAVAEALRALDIAYIALTPGASFRGLHDSLVNHLGNERPQMLIALHEEHAVAIAHGWAKVTGRAMAAAVHSNVGLMHAAMAVFNAWCDGAPISTDRGHRARRSRTAAAVDRLGSHRARPGGAGAGLCQVGRSAGLGGGGARGDRACTVDRRDGAAGARLRQPRRRPAGGAAGSPAAAARCCPPRPGRAAEAGPRARAPCRRGARRRRTAGDSGRAGVAVPRGVAAAHRAGGGAGRARGQRSEALPPRSRPTTLCMPARRRCGPMRRPPRRFARPMSC